MSIVEFLSQPLWQRLGLTLVHFLWQGLAVAVLVGVLVRVFRLNHGNARYAAYLLAFIAMMVCPVVTFTAIDIPISPNAGLVTGAEFAEVVDSSSYTALSAGDILPEAETSSPVIPTLADSIPLGQRISDWLNVWMPWVLVIWMVGVIVLSVRLLMGFVGVYRWRHHLQPLPERLVQRIASLSERLGMRGFSQVFISPTVLQAMAVGYLRPMVLLPAVMVTRMQPEMLEAVIAHELAHIRRLDLWVNLAQRVTETLLFYHPAVWWLSICLRSERELCCDELAVKATGERITYATTLESVGRARFMAKQPVLAAGLGQDNKPTLSRVRHVLGLAPTQRNCPFWLAGVITVLFLAALVIPTTLALTSRADEPAEMQEKKDHEGLPEFTKTLANGVMVEVVGVCDHPSEGRQWWRPDGSLLEEAPYDDFFGRAFPKYGEKGYKFAVKLSGLAGADFDHKIMPLKFRTTQGGGGSWPSEKNGKKNTKYIDGSLDEMIDWLGTSFPEAMVDCEIEVGVCFGDWKDKYKYETDKPNDGVEWVRFENVSLRRNFKTEYDLDERKRIVKQSESQARLLNHEYVGTEHILLALVAENSEVVSVISEKFRIGRERIYNETLRVVKKGENIITMRTLPVTARAQSVFKNADQWAKALNSDTVKSQHVLLGLLQVEDGVAGQVLMNLGVNLEKAQEAITHPQGLKDESKRFDQEKLQKYLAMELEGISGVKEAAKADSVKRGAREAIEMFVAAAMAGDFEKARQFADPNKAVADQVADMPEILQGQNLWIMAVVADDFDAIAVSSVILGDHDRIGPLVFFLDRKPQDGRDNWWVDDIDLETPDGAEVGLKRFLEKHPEAQKVPYENKPAVQVEGENKMEKLDIETLLSKVRKALQPTDNMRVSWQFETVEPFGVGTTTILHTVREYIATISGSKSRLECLQKTYTSKASKEPYDIRRMSYVFDGRESLYLEELIKSAKTTSLGWWSAQNVTVVLLYQELFACILPLYNEDKLNEYELNLVDSPSPGIYVIKVIEIEDGTPYQITIDGSRGFNIINTQWFGPKNTKTLEDTTVLRQYDDGIWYPAERRRIRYYPNGTQKLEHIQKFSKLELDVKVPEETFKLEFPPGTKTWDTTLEDWVIISDTDTFGAKR